MNLTKMRYSAGKKRIILWLFAVTLIAPLMGYKGLFNMLKQNIEISKLNKKLAETEKENKELKKSLYALENDSAVIERESRKMGLVKPGEIKYKFVERAY